MFLNSNIYENNIFNQYFYSPAFALIIRPLSILPLVVGRVIWAIFNVFLAIRLYQIIHNILLKDLAFSTKQKGMFWGLLLVFSFGYYNLNLNLGQITIIILWLSIEGLYQIQFRKRKLLGSSLIAVGICIKIIPVLLCYYLFLKREYKALFVSLGMLTLLLLMPFLFFETDYVIELHQNWWGKINPENSEYLVVQDPGIVSLNALVPNYFYFQDVDFFRRIMELSPAQIKLLIRAFQMLLALCLFVFIRKLNVKSTHLYWEWCLLWLCTLLVFPHQQRYALFYMVPVYGYLLFLIYSESFQYHKTKKILLYILFSAFTFSAIIGRDIIGSTLFDLLDYYKWNSLLVIIGIIILPMLKPLKKATASNKKTEA